jgi:uncharacterized membrane protein
MNIDIIALLKSKIFWANVIGLIVAIAAIFGVTPDMTGKTAEYATTALAALNIILRLFSQGQIISKK